MRRREVIAGLGAAAIAGGSGRALAQRRNLPLVGFLNSSAAADWEPRLAAFHRGLAAAGFVDGRNATLVYRWADYSYDRLPGLAADLVRQEVDVLVATGGDKSIEAARAATKTIPIVFTTGGDPVAAGYVQSLSRPGGNATGATFVASTLEAKRLAVLHETEPRAREIAVLFGPGNTRTEHDRAEIEEAARTLGLRVRFIKLGGDADFEMAAAEVRREKTDAIQFVSDPFFDPRAVQLVRLTSGARLPAIYSQRDFPAAGGLLSYGAALEDAYQKVGDYVGKILKGARVADLPLQQVDRIELVVNLKTAKSLGIAVPLSLLGRADEVIE